MGNHDLTNADAFASGLFELLVDQAHVECRRLVRDFYNVAWMEGTYEAVRFLAGKRNRALANIAKARYERAPSKVIGEEVVALTDVLARYLEIHAEAWGRPPMLKTVMSYAPEPWSEVSNRRLDTPDIIKWDKEVQAMESVLDEFCEPFDGVEVDDPYAGQDTDWMTVMDDLYE